MSGELDRLQLLADQIATRLSEFHAANPKRLGPEAVELRIALRAEPEVFDLACRLLLSAHRLEQHGTVLAAPGWKARVSSDEETLCERVGRALQDARWTPPTSAALAADTASAKSSPPAAAASATDVPSSRFVIFAVPVISQPRTTFNSEPAASFARKPAASETTSCQRPGPAQQPSRSPVSSPSGPMSAIVFA